MLMPSVLFFGSGHLRGSWFLRVPKKPAILVERRSTAVPFGDAPRARGAAISTRRRPGRNFVVADWTDSMNYGVTLWRVAVVACLPRPGLSFLACPSVLRACPAAGSLCSRSSVRSTNDVGQVQEGNSTPVPPHLDRSAPPAFIEKNNLSLDGGFIVSKEGEPTAEELANENVIKVVAEKCTDEELNWLLWKCLGYRYNPDDESWTADKVFPLWKEKYPAPPDLVGVTRVYEKEVDQPVMKAVQSLVRAVPGEHKRSIVEQLKPIGFTGLKVNELTPNRTRRAQATNFILYFREQLWGVSLEELRRRRKERAEEEARKPLMPPDASQEPDASQGA